jgi:hypothetical protein
MISNHAKQRMQQRAIPPLVLDLLYRYGREQKQQGSTVIYFDEKSRRRARKSLQDVVKRFDKLCDVYLVESDDCAMTVTVGHRNKRVKSR